MSTRLPDDRPYLLRAAIVAEVCAGCVSPPGLTMFMSANLGMGRTSVNASNGARAMDIEGRED